MKRLNQKQKNWALAKTRKVYKTRLKFSNSIETSRRNENRLSENRFKRSTIWVNAPERLDIVTDPEETLTYYKEIRETIKRSPVNGEIFFNFAPIEHISIDAIMYIITLIKNSRKVAVFQIVCKGNLPENELARSTIESSGFYNHVRNLNNKPASKSTNQIQITGGTNADGKLASEICEFVHRACNATTYDTKRLYSLISELMTNTTQHAYNNTSEFMRYWYIYAENTDECVQFVFLDTGAGIPATVRKKPLESVYKMFSNKSDAGLISSALKGDFRTETNERHRGRGLPGIREDASSGRLTALFIVSGFGQCSVDEQNNIHENHMGFEFTGTLVKWKFVK